MKKLDEKTVPNDSILLLAEASKMDIKDFIDNNPNVTINEFSDLHDHYDANCYVESYFKNVRHYHYTDANKLIDELDTFIKTLKK